MANGNTSFGYLLPTREVVMAAGEIDRAKDILASLTPVLLAKPEVPGTAPPTRRTARSAYPLQRR